MSKQQESIPRIIQRVAACGIDAGLILGGSVRYGYERSDSDLDFFAIAELGLDRALHEFSLVSVKNGCKLLELQADAFPVHVAYWSTQSFEWVLNTIPYMTYPIFDGQIVYDPVGLAERYRSIMGRYFDVQPKLKAAWVRQLNDLRSFKTGRLRSLEFGQWSDFIRHLEETVLKETA